MASYIEFYSLEENLGKEEEDKSIGVGAVATGEPLPQPGRCGKRSVGEYKKGKAGYLKSHNPNKRAYGKQREQREEGPGTIEWQAAALIVRSTHRK